MGAADAAGHTAAAGRRLVGAAPAPAIGKGILASIDAIADVDPTVPPTGANLDGGAGAAYAADVIVVLTDGANTQGVDPATAAKEAAARRLRVFTIGFGTTTPAP